MTDIVERLREGGFARPDEAADEIETLRQRVKELEGYKSAWVATSKLRDKAERELATTQTAKERFHEAFGETEENPLERLRFFCSLAMNGQDWLDVEPFFDDVETMIAGG